MMQRHSFMYAGLPALAAVAAIYAASPAFAQATVIIAPNAPPAPEVETIPAPPTTMMAWQPGHWTWTSSGWSWVPGQYIQRPQQTAVWQPGHWVQQPDGSYSWMDGHWQMAGG
jgi:hypothetical protein